jgi:ribonuclease T2
MTSVSRTALLLIALCVSTALADARSRHGHAPPSQQAAAAARFDYYLLSLSWSPVFCETHPKDPQCGSKRFGFVLHGLWPQLNGTRRLENCPTSERLTDAARSLGKTIYPTEKLMVHEWDSHGTCSGMSAIDYFRISDRARDGIGIPPQFEPGTRTQTMTAADVTKTIRDVNPALTGQSIVVTCSGPELAEVRVCLSKELHPVKCGSGVKSSCRPGPMRIPGTR